MTEVLLNSLQSSNQPAMPGAAPPDDFSVQKIFRILRKRKKTILWTLGLCIALAVVAIFVVTTRYESTVTVEVNATASDMLNLSNNLSGMMNGNGMDYNVNLQSDADILGSDTLMLQVIQELKLEGTDPDFTAKIWPWTSAEARAEVGKPLAQAPLRRAKFLKRFNKNLGIKVVPGTRLFTVSYDDPNPVVAAAVANRLVADFLTQYTQVRYSATISVSGWLSHQLDELRTQVEESERKLADFQKKTGLMAAVVPGASPGGGVTQTAVADIANNVVMQKFTQVNQELTQAQATKMNAQAIYDLTRSGDPEVISTLTTTGLATGAIASQVSAVQAMRMQEAQLKSALADMRSKYDVNYPRVVQAQQQLNDMQQTIKTEVAKISARAASDLKAAGDNEAALQKAYGEAKGEAGKMNDAATQFLALSEDAVSGRMLYEDLLSKLKEAEVLAGLGSTNIDVVDPGRVSALSWTQWASPNVPLYLGLAVGVGLMFGCGMAFLREELDNSILTSAQVEEVTTAPVLVSIPDPRTSQKRGYGYGYGGYGAGSKDPKTWQSISVSEHPKSTFAEVYRSLRSSLLLSNVDRHPQTIMVTSGLPGEGKSTTSHNLGAILAQNGSRVLLVNADMRRPSQAYGGTASPAAGLSAILSGVAPHASPTPDPVQSGLFIVGPGPHPPYPAELLGSKRAASIIDEWRTMYDYIVFDTPPLLLLTDAVVLARHADAVVLVVRYGRSTKQALRASVKMLDAQRIPLTGIVINATDTSATEYTSYYGYGYAEYGAYAAVSDSDGGKNEK